MFALYLAAVAAGVAATPPNIIYILVDDFGYVSADQAFRTCTAKDRQNQPNLPHLTLHHGKNGAGQRWLSPQREQ